MKTYKTLFLIISISFVTVIGCSSKPSASDGEKVAQNMIIKNQSDEIIRLKSLNKVNAIDKEDIYILEYEAEIEFLKNGSLASPQRFLANTVIGFGQIGKAYSKGEVVKYKGSMEFQKTENGWKGIDGEIY